MKSNGLNIEKTGKPAHVGAAPKKPSKKKLEKYMTCDEFRQKLKQSILELYGIVE